MTVSAFVINQVRNSRMRLRDTWLNFFMSWIRLVGPAFAVSIGYIDPGNWATDLAAGAFQYQLLWSVLLAGGIALVLQITVAKLAAYKGRDLAQLMAERWKLAVPFFWGLYQLAAMATDLAEFSGIVLGIQMLFGWPLIVSLSWAVAIMAFVLAITRRSVQTLQLVLLAAVAIIAAAILTQMVQLHPAWSLVVDGATRWYIPNHGALVAIIGIIGATVMPHNLFLHPSLVVKSTERLDVEKRRSSTHVFIKETIFALAIATLVNGGLLIIGAELNGGHGSLQNAFASLQLHSPHMATVFGAALLLSGVAATVTATAAGDYIFAAFSPFSVPTIVRRFITLLPAVLLLYAGISLNAMLVWSQVVLGFILPLVILPLFMIILREKIFGNGIGGRLFIGAIAAAGGICIVLDGLSIVQLFA